MFLQKPLPSFGEVGVETAKNCKIHSHAFLEREWKSKESSKSTPARETEESAFSKKRPFPLSQVQKEGVENPQNQKIHSQAPETRECKTHRIKKYTPQCSNQGSGKVQKSRNALPQAKVEGVQKPKKQETRSRLPTTTIEEECKTSISQKTLSSVNPECGWIGASGLRELKKLRNRFNQCLTGLILRDMKYCMKGGMQWMCN